VIAALCGESHTVRHAFQAQTFVSRALSRAAATPATPPSLSIPVDVLRADASPTAVFAAVAPLQTADEAIVRMAAGELADAHRGLVGLGVGARPHGLALGPVLERLGWPVVTDAEGRGVIPDDHPLRVGCIGVGDDGSAQAW